MFKRPSLGALLVAAVPFLAMCFSVALWDRVDPMVLGLPFNLFWLICWIVLSSLSLWLAYRLEVSGSKSSAVPKVRSKHGSETDGRP